MAAGRPGTADSGSHLGHFPPPCKPTHPFYTRWPQPDAGQETLGTRRPQKLRRRRCVLHMHCLNCQRICPPRRAIVGLPPKNPVETDTGTLVTVSSGPDPPPRPHGRHTAPREKKKKIAVNPPQRKKKSRRWRHQRDRATRNHHRALPGNPNLDNPCRPPFPLFPHCGAADLRTTSPFLALSCRVHQFMKK